MSNEQACYTFEAALDMAVEMEDAGFRNYLTAIRMVRDKAAREILRDAAMEELDHKRQLEQALLEGEMGGHVLDRPVPTMNLDYVLKTRQLSSDADSRQALAYAIHLEKESLDFYQRMMQGCAGAPMASVFERLFNDESRHLQTLEDLYEKHFLPEN